MPWCNAVLQSPDLAVFIFAANRESTGDRNIKTSYQLAARPSQRFFPEARVLFEKVISLNHCDKPRHEARNTYKSPSRFWGKTSSQFVVEQVPGYAKCSPQLAEMEYSRPRIGRSNPATIAVLDI